MCGGGSRPQWGSVGLWDRASASIIMQQLLWNLAIMLSDGYKDKSLLTSF